MSDLSAYPEHYPQYCGRIDILENNANRIRTRELWNLSIGDLDHIVVGVDYHLEPMKSISYKIVSGFGEGIENQIELEVRGEDKTRLSINLVPLDVFKLLYPKNTEVYSNMISYFVRRDAKILEGKYKGFEAGQLCKHCKKGHLIA
jgi:hypothetical protein